ncbi:FeoB-associated Cys-rich membrane protein [Ruminococcus sp.]|uniref:FeoB-associated Cys-rich membrane protein n=1 Tax=Ruminococcus sp. TaxID=41978 RepID=UPI0025EF46D7|nr:FeoB-associated Cys-rich membrane protein [Ruminococcus sp.]MCI6616264.1 FeoB-associated Cys-rich membrane protein [Ruminococcus sp.]
MIAWIYQNLATIIISLIIVAVVAAIIISTVRNRKKGKSYCGCGCSNCPMSGSCHSQK